MAAGKTVEVVFEIGADKLGFYDQSGNYTVEKGKIEIFVGKDCLTQNSVTIEII